MRASPLLPIVLLIAGAALITIGWLGWRRRLPRNRFAGVRTPATLRSQAAFSAANRVAAAPVGAAGVICAAGGALALRAHGAQLAVIVGITGAGTVGLVLAGGLLGHRTASAMGWRPHRVAAPGAPARVPLLAGNSTPATR